VGEGIIVDVSRYMTGIIEINIEEAWVRVQPGVVLDELNMVLAEKGLFFAPETSTSNRCMIGGMIGNNACGSHSLIYGSTRDHLLSANVLLSDGSSAVFENIETTEAFFARLEGNKLENLLYQQVYDMLIPENIRNEILECFPDPAVKRRNTGYALDILADMLPFSGRNKAFNFCSLLAGSEGTLAFVTEAKLSLIPVPPPVKGLLCVQLHNIEEALQANLICLKHNPGAVELMDNINLECTKSNIEQSKNRFFLKGDPGALLIVEFARNSSYELKACVEDLRNDLINNGLGYHYPLVTGDDINKVWALRKSGLGVLSNIPGDAKPVSLIEDTAVRPDLLPGYVAGLKEILAEYNLDCVFHAHVGTGELHVRPIINLKDPHGIVLLRQVISNVAVLVKKYRGSLSGEHGDGRVRSEFIPVIIGENNYRLIQNVKRTWDPEGVFNRGKIVDPPGMDVSTRYSIKDNKPFFSPVFSYGPAEGILSHAEMCNGSGGLIHPIESGVYNINERMRKDLLNNLMGEHASNLGGLIAQDIAEILPKCRAFIADPVVVDELQDVSRLSGHPLFQRISIFHALNQKATARSYARLINRKYEDLNLVIAHMGGGISVGAHKKGKVIDVNQALNGEGPFSPERSGTLPAGALVKLCFEKKYTYDEIKTMITGNGGYMAYMGTNSAYEIELMAQDGDNKARLIQDAMSYQIGKEIASMSATLHGETDSIILTGGISHNPMVVEYIKKMVSFIAPVVIYPGEDEMHALAMNGLMVLKGEIIPKDYDETTMVSVKLPFHDSENQP